MLEVLPNRHYTSQHPCDPALGGVVWHVLQTEPAHEFYALNAVAELPGLRPYLPVEVRRRVAMRGGRPVIENGQRKREDVLRPFFPGYLFVAFDPRGAEWAPIMRRNRETRTVKLFCDTAWRPMRVPDGVIAALQARGRAGDGAIDLEAPSFAPLAVGQSVRLPGGPFEDLGGVVRWTDQRRVEVLLGMLRVTVDRAQVEAA